jgi:hypothetical protein
MVGIVVIRALGDGGTLEYSLENPGNALRCLYGDLRSVIRAQRRGCNLV